jgi:hypothetical protein
MLIMEPYLFCDRSQSECWREALPLTLFSVTQNVDDEFLAVSEAGQPRGIALPEKIIFCRGCAPLPALTSAITGIFSM